MVAFAPFLISTAVSFGSSALLSLFGRPQKPVTVREVNKLENFDYPNSAYGESIPDVYGKVRVRGIYVAAQVPPDWERDDSYNGTTREWTLTYIYYGRLGVLWATKPTVTNNAEIAAIHFNRQRYYNDGQIDGILGQYWGRFEGLSLNNHLGGQTTWDSELGFMGSNHVSYTGRVITVMKRLRLNNSDGGLFDSRYPDLEAVIDTYPDGGRYLDDIIADILQKGGYSSQEYDVTELNNVEVRGFKAPPATIADKLSQLQWAYAFEVVDTGSQLKFVKANRPAASAYISPDNFAAREDGSQRPDLFTEEIDQAIADLPTQVRVLFSDYNNDYLPGEKLSFEINLGANQNIEEIDLSNLTLTESEALTIANRVLLLAWLRRRTYKFSILPKFCGLEAGDVLTCEFRPGQTESVQIKRINHAANGVIEIEAYPYDASIYGNAFTVPATRGDTATATQGSPITLGASALSVSSVVGPGGVTYQQGTDYTVNLGTNTITPVNGGGIPNGTAITIIYTANPVPASPPPPLTLPENPYANLPRVLSFSPTQGKIGDAITINGANFTGATSAKINGVDLGSLVIVSDSVVTGTVAVGTTNGKVTVTNPTGTGESLADFVVITSAVDWGDIGGNLPDQEDLDDALNAREPTINPGAPSQYWRGDKTWQPLNKSAVGLGNVDNTSDANKPISTATQTALNEKFNNPSGTPSQYIRGDGNLATFPTIPTPPTTVKIPGVYAPLSNPANGTVYLFTATANTTINQLRQLKTASGTCTVTIQINGVNVTGLTNLSVTSTPQNPTATGANVANVGQDVTLIIASVSSAAKLQFTLDATLPLA